jgi:hypothetical protein
MAKPISGLKKGMSAISSYLRENLVISHVANFNPSSKFAVVIIWSSTQNETPYFRRKKRNKILGHGLIKNII